jgi:hypothetical protein
MDIKVKRYLVFVVAVMAVFTVYVRLVVLRPVASAAGPPVTHPLDGRYDKNCDICHRKEIPFHQETFGYFSDCMRCHGGAPAVTHPTGGDYVGCWKCHGEIEESHDAMFPHVSYNDCLGCHFPK